MKTTTISELRQMTGQGNRGKSFEGDLETLHDMYRLQGTVDMSRQVSGWEFCGEFQYYKLPPGRGARTNNGRYLRRVKSDIDFRGGNASQSVAFDAKETSGKSLPLANIEGHQIARLENAAKCGTTAGVLVKFTELNRVFFVPIDYLLKRFRKWVSFPVGRSPLGTASLSVRDLEANGVEVPSVRGMFDWFEVIGK